MRSRRRSPRAEERRAQGAGGEATSRARTPSRGRTRGAGPRLSQRSEHGGQLRAMFGGLEVEQRVRRQEMLRDDVVLADVDGWEHLCFRVRLNGDRDAVGAGPVDEQLQRNDAVVNDATGTVPEKRAREVGLLMPQLRRA